MKEQTIRQLKKELQEAGASSAEASQLSGIATKLPQLKGYKHIKDEGVGIKNRQWRWLKPLTGVLTGLAFGALLILVSQSALPTSWLYSVQKFSDSVVIDIHPQYRANIMMKRAQQVNALVANHASSSKVLATLADYTNQAKIYKTMPHADYAAFEFCKTNLQQATLSASPAVKRAIQSSLQSLEST